MIRRLLDDLAARESVLVALSGGVDSTVVAALAHRALAGRAMAATAAAETLAATELDDARRVAVEIGIRHEILTYSELDEPEFVANPVYRCYVCQGLRMDRMLALAAERGIELVCDGTNASDPGPDRPGLAAVRERGVYSPLLEHGVDKESTRAIALALGLSVWDKPADACLSSRIPHGQRVTVDKLRRIESAERVVAELGFRSVRVRHDRTGARVEVESSQVALLLRHRPEIEGRLLALGFDVVSIEPAGYRAGGADRLPVVA